MNIQKMSPKMKQRRQQSERQWNGSAAETTSLASVMAYWRLVGRSGLHVPEWPQTLNGSSAGDPAHSGSGVVSWLSGASVRTPTDWTNWNVRRSCRSVRGQVLCLERWRRWSCASAGQCYTSRQNWTALSLSLTWKRSNNSRSLARR